MQILPAHMKVSSSRTVLLPPVEIACPGGYTYASMKCEVSCVMKNECREATGDNLRHAEVEGVHEHICDSCGCIFVHLSLRTPRWLLCVTCQSKDTNPPGGAAPR